MTILDRLLGHDAWTTRQLLLRCRELSEEQMSQPFDIGCGNLQETFNHLLSCMEKHTATIAGHPYVQIASEDASVEGMLARLTVVAKEFADCAIQIERTGKADEMCMNAGQTWRGSRGGLIAHLITHSMHHRAQILYMMDRIGLPDVIEGDALGWEAQVRGWGWIDGGSYGTVASE